jgi:hypothetical protein
MSRILAAMATAIMWISAGCTIGATGFATDFESYHEATIRASTSEALVGQDGRCQSDVSIDPFLFRSLGPQGVPLGSTECEVVGRLGGPYSVEIRRGPPGERLVRLTYVSGAKLGIYHFVNNRLTSIEH